MSFAYYNYGKQIQGRPGSEHAPSYCIVTLVPKMTWTSGGNSLDYLDPDIGVDHDGRTYRITTYENRRKSVIKLVYLSGSGVVGSFSLTALINSMVQVLVLYGFAGTVTLWYAKNRLGVESELYENVIEEKVSRAGRRSPPPPPPLTLSPSPP